jgi:hypothetical protein
LVEGEPDEAHADRVTLIALGGDWVGLGGIGSILGNFEVPGPSPEESTAACYILEDEGPTTFYYFWVDEAKPDRLHRAHG